MASSEMSREVCCEAENFSRKEVTRSGISLLRSRSAGSLTCTTFRRKYRSCRNAPALMAESRSRLVAAMMRTSMRRRSVEPTGFTSRSCNARRSLACRSTGMSPISSRKSVPPLAASSRPCLPCRAPVNALHALGDADQPAEAGTGAQLFAQQLIFLLQLDGACGALQARTQLLNAKRFRYIVDHAQARGSHRGIDGSILC